MSARSRQSYEKIGDGELSILALKNFDTVCFSVYLRQISEFTVINKVSTEQVSINSPLINIVIFNSIHRRETLNDAFVPSALLPGN